MSKFENTGDSMLEMYLFESSTLLEQLDEILLQSEEDGLLSEESVNEIFRIMHTIKGSSAMMEFDTLAAVSHKLEDLFYIIRENGLDEEHFSELMDLVLKVSDFLKEGVERISQNQSLPTDNEVLLAELESMHHLLQDEAETPVEPEKITAPQEQSPEATNGKTFHLHVRFSADSQMENIRAFMLVNKLESMGAVVETIPPDLNDNKDAASIISRDGFYCSLVTDQSESEIRDAAKGTLSVETVNFIDALPKDTNQTDAQVKEEKAGNTTDSQSKSVTKSNNSVNAPAGKQNLINVDLNKLDDLMDLVGEIVITESMVIECVDLEGLELENFNKSARQLRKLTDELQDIVMSIRMIPIASTFHKMRRIVRDMGKKLNKEAELVLMGESTEVDKTIIDGIADPLMHLVRNAMDHAIEDKETRLDQNKDPVGRIILSAQNVGSDIIITVSDDGKGIDPNWVLDKANEKGLLTKPENEYTEKEIFQLLTLPGFSTKESVTEFSGRGVGMDVVKKNVEKIGGTVTIDSTLGEGTNVYFKIPLTLAIIASMEIKVGDGHYTIPITNIRESLKVDASQLITDPDNNEMILIRGVCYPIIRLHKIFHLEDAITNIEDGILLLVDSGDRLACIFADELLGKSQVVVKPLPTYLKRFKSMGSGLAGCTIRGDGSISLILDVPNILNQN
ncbi:MAG: chemotaxis protein CheW [Anaerovoracaceae bacterium]|jgi:two-component system chemotaxis sensor kinase CheA